MCVCVLLSIRIGISLKHKHYMEKNHRFLRQEKQE